MRSLSVACARTVCSRASARSDGLPCLPWLQLKRKGNAHFKAGEFSDAAVCYRKGIYYSGFDESQFNFELHDVHREQVCKVIVPLRLNYALCLLKDGYRPLRAPLPAREDRCKEAVEQCNEVLALFKNKEAELQLQPPDRVKALHRRALARLEAHAHALPIGDLDKAKEDLSEALKAEPSNQEIRRALTNLKGQEKEERARQRKVWGGALQHGLPSLPGELNDEEEVCTVSPSAGSAGRDACLGGGGDVSGSSARAGGGDTAGKEEREKREHAEKVRAELQRELDKLEGASAAPPAAGGWGSSIKRWLGFGPR